MSLTGYIKNLFIDKEKTIPLFPRTKVKAVSDDDGVGLNVLLDEIKNEITPMSKGGTDATDGATGLKNLFAAGETILSDYQYGPEKPVDGRIGQVFFEEATGTIADIGQDVAAAVRARNLLDNSDFRNPINQRGSVTYTGSYGIDRWRTWDSDTMTNWNANNGIGVECSGYMFQYFERGKFSGIHTLAAKKADGTLLIYSASAESYTMSENGLGFGDDGTAIIVALPTGTYVWAALYEGEYTAETLPPYVPKGYTAELIECRRYFKRFNSWGGVGSGYMNYQGMPAIWIFQDAAMRNTPTATSLTGSFYTITGVFAVTNATPTVNQNHDGRIVLTFPNNKNDYYKDSSCTLNLGNSIFELSADL